jgi:hypothetical protein
MGCESCCRRGLEMPILYTKSSGVYWGVLAPPNSSIGGDAGGACGDPGACPTPAAPCPDCSSTNPWPPTPSQLAAGSRQPPHLVDLGVLGKVGGQLMVIQAHKGVGVKAPSNGQVRRGLAERGAQPVVDACARTGAAAVRGRCGATAAWATAAAAAITHAHICRGHGCRHHLLCSRAPAADDSPAPPTAPGIFSRSAAAAGDVDSRIHRTAASTGQQHSRDAPAAAPRRMLRMPRDSRARLRATLPSRKGTCGVTDAAGLPPCLKQQQQQQLLLLLQPRAGGLHRPRLYCRTAAR